MTSQHKVICVFAFVLSMTVYASLQLATAQVTGSGTLNYITKWTGTSAVGNSSLFDNGLIGLGTTAPNFAGYGGNSKVFTINATGGTIGLGVVELATDRVPTDQMEIGDVATSLMDNTLGPKRISRLLTLASGNSANNRGGVLSFRTKQDGVASSPVERMRITDAGNVGIGTSSPASLLTVAGTIQSTTGGIKFPDGTVQTTASTGGGGIWLTSGANIYNSNTGGVGIGTSTVDTFKLKVNGTIKAKEVIVDINGWPDYVFSADHELISLPELEQSVKSSKHLPGMPTAEEASKDGIHLGQLQSKFLMKIEELTLYLIEQDKKLTALEKENAHLKASIEDIKGKNN